MYDALYATCDLVDASDLRVLLIRGAGGAFAAGTDISQFREFRSGDDGIAYERRLDRVIDRLEAVRPITIAAIDGVAAGGGCAISLACDLRICSTRAQFGVPIAKTLGNCLSAANTARLVEMIGVARAKELLLTGRLMDANEAMALGLVTRLVSTERIDQEASAFAEELCACAPSTVRASKAMLARLRASRPLVDADDIVGACYASNDFREGVSAFLEKRKPRW